MLIYTIGHSARPWDQFFTLLKHYKVELLVDVRTVPKSRHVPHFNSEVVKQALHKEDIEYQHQRKLGGLRKPIEDSVNLGWRNSSFRGFADYMQTEEFRKGLMELSDLVAERRAVLMCAEAVPWRCHRSLIADALLVRKWEVWHIISPTSLQAHELTPFAVIEGERIIYPKVKQSRSST
ncbi:MAG: DUF488 family protein [Candidatus Binatia bacterium]